jgi:protein involved in temperature-dependent protein secretion
MTIKNKAFLTLKQAKENADWCQEFKDGSYQYGINEECFLIEDDNVSIHDIDNDCCAFTTENEKDL